MSTTHMKDKDGFSYVTHKKKKNLKPSSLHDANSLPNLHATMNDIKDELKESEFVVKFKENLHTVFQEWNLGHIIFKEADNCDAVNTNEYSKQEIDIVCYGLGQFSTCVIARYQLAFLLILKHILQSTSVYIYDPQFSSDEIEFLKQLCLNVLNINEEGKRILNKKSLCFMPHCDLPLYNNLLWANWNSKNLSDMIIIGNSFQSYEMNDARGRLKEKAKYVYLVNRFISEIRISNVFRFTDIFNDLSIHYFKSSSLSVVDSCVWLDVNEPEYSDDDDIIKSNKMGL